MALRVVVTGANTGVGRATAEALGERGAEVTLACRSLARGEPVLRALVDAGHPARLVQLDLAELASVRHAAAAVRATGPIDVLINNAAVGGARGVTADGFELAFGVNYLGHYLLTRLLLPTLRRGGRVVHLGSGSHEQIHALDLDALRRPTRTLTGVDEYAASKLCVMLFHQALSRRLEGSALRSVAADPGDVASDAYRHVPWPARWWMTRGMQTPAEGARTPLFCALSEEANNGILYAEERPRAPSALARDPALADALWQHSEAWTLAPAPTRIDPR